MLNENITRRLLLQIAVWAVTFSAYAQTVNVIEGRVSSMGTVIPAAHILNYSDLSVATYTDMDGRFSFNSTDSIFIVTALGYEWDTIRFTGDFLEVELKAKTDLLDRIVVTDGRSEKRLKESTVSIELIQPNLLENTAPINVYKSINRINGVQVVDGQANIRAGSGWSYGAGSRVQILVNGLPMLSGDAASAQWNFIPTEGVERIEIIKGASSVVYGSSALNGVINIKTRTSASRPFTAVSFTTGFYDLPKRESLDYGQGRPNVSNVSAFHVGRIEGLDFTLGLNMLYDDSYKMNDYMKRARTSFGLRKSWAERQLVIGINSSVQRGLGASFLLWDSYKNGYVSLDGGLTETKSWRVALDPYLTWIKGEYTHKVRHRYLRVGNAVDNGDSTIDQSNFSNLFFTEYQVNRDWQFGLRSIGGVVHQFSNTKSPLYSGNQTTSNLAAYLQLEQKLWNKLLLTAGARYESYRLNNRTESKPVFRFGLNWSIYKATFLRMSYGQGYRFPSVAETYVSTKVGPVQIFSNPDLMSETGDNYEIGLKQGYKLGKLLGFIDIALYQMNFSNMTEFAFGNWDEFKSFDNPGIGFKSINLRRTLVKGIEVSNVFSGRLKGIDIQGFIGYNINDFRALDRDSIVYTNFYGKSFVYDSTATNVEGSFLKYRP